MKTAILIFLLFANNSIHACIAKQMPDERNFDMYSQIFIAEVTGIELFEYEINRLQSLSKGDDRRWFGDLTLPHNLNVIVTEVFKGKPDAKLRFKVGGCGVVTPNTMMYGVFFVDKKTKKVISIYENEGKLYYDLLVKLGAKFR